MDQFSAPSFDLHRVGGGGNTKVITEIRTTPM